MRWPWSLLAQPEPFPERVLSATADAVVDNALATWGSSALPVPDEVRQEYIEWADNVRGHAVEGGHFFPEAAPATTVAALRTFLAEYKRVGPEGEAR